MIGNPSIYRKKKNSKRKHTTVSNEELFYAPVPVCVPAPDLKKDEQKSNLNKKIGHGHAHGHVNQLIQSVY